jgi:inorganic pyrophosphatase
LYRYAEEVIHECAEAWQKLISGSAPRGEISL